MDSIHLLQSRVMKANIQRLLQALERDSLVEIKKLLEEDDIDLESDVIVGEEYDMEEPDEIPLLFYAIMHGASLEAIEMMIEAGMPIDTYTREGIGALDIAIKYKRSDIVKLCKEHGISLTTTKRKSGMTPIMLAAGFNDKEMVEFLLKEGADPSERDKHGMNAMDYASRLGFKKMKSFIEDKISEKKSKS